MGHLFETDTYGDQDPPGRAVITTEGLAPPL